MSHTVTFFYLGPGGQEEDWTSPFPLHDDLQLYMSRAAETIASAKRANAPPDGPRPDGLRIEDEEGVVVFRYPSSP